MSAHTTPITIHDKTFKELFSMQTIEHAIAQVAEQINATQPTEPLLIISVLNGSFMFSAQLIKQLHFPCEISFVKLSSYQGTASTGSLKQILGLDCSVNNRRVLILEDIVDTGNTIAFLTQELKAKGAAEVTTATLLFKPDAFQGAIKPTYIGLHVPDKFIVGYGLDYNGLGRNLNAIYELA